MRGGLKSNRIRLKPWRTATSARALLTAPYRPRVPGGRGKFAVHGKQRTYRGGTYLPTPQRERSHEDVPSARLNRHTGVRQVCAPQQHVALLRPHDHLRAALERLL